MDPQNFRSKEVGEFMDDRTGEKDNAHDPYRNCTRPREHLEKPVQGLNDTAGEEVEEDEFAGKEKDNHEHTVT